MTIKDILGINNAKLIIGSESTQLDNFSKDTRTINYGDTYIGIKGENFNGSEFYKEAFKNGAKTCILSDVEIDNEELNLYHDKNIILVDDTIEFLVEIAKIKRNNLHIPIIAVTGSVGKTSTRNIIASVLETKYRVLKTKENLNTNIGLALTLLSYQDEEIIVLEMGMNHFGEIKELSLIARPDLAVITNIGTAHIGNLGSRENILQAKLEILEGLTGPVIINNDNDLLHAWKDKNHGFKIITFGMEQNSDYQASNIIYDKSGSHFKLGMENVSINVIGKHFIYNSLVAFAIADIYEIPHKNVIDAIKDIRLEPNRMELITKEYTIINDTYNASFDSVYYALEVLGSFKKRKIAVLGDILELGEYGEEIHKNIGEVITKFNIDILITVGSLAKFINEIAIKKGFNKENSYHFDTNKDAIDKIKEIIAKDDTILVKASNSMNFIEIVNAIK